MAAEEAELVFIPSPGMGHLVSTVEIAKQLLHRDQRLSITVLIMEFPFEKSSATTTTSSPASSYTQSLQLTAELADRLLFVYLPRDDESSAELLSKSPTNFMTEFVDMNKRHVRDHVTKMTESGESTRLAGFVVDMFCTQMMDVAAEFGLPTYVFFTSNAAFLGFLFHIHSLHQDHNQDVTELTQLSVPTFVNPVPANVLPSPVLDKTGGGLTMVLNTTKRLKETKGIMVNTFTELESHAIMSLTEDGKLPTVYPVGPVLNLKRDQKEEEEAMLIMRWLDNQPPSSVVFLCFGSMGSFERNQVMEIAQALERSGHRFLWSVRRPPPKGKIGSPSDYDNPNEVLPKGFMERTAEIGKVIGWAPQVAVLSHGAVGGFVSHCGWNSILESLWCGVPVATWPMSAEQQMNAFQMVRELGLAVEIKLDYRKDIVTTEDKKIVIVMAEEIEDRIRQLMEEGGGEIKHKVKEMSQKSKIAAVEGGSSYISIGCFIEDVMNNTP